MSNRLGGKQGTAYTGTNANQPPNWTFNDRVPTQFDSFNYSVGDLWLNQAEPNDNLKVWMLVSLQGTSSSKGQLAHWIQLNSGAATATKLAGDSGVNPVVPNGADTINVVGNNAVGLTVSGDGINTLTVTSFSGQPFVLDLTGNGGGPVPADAASNINILGDNALGLTVIGNPGTNTLTIETTGGSPILQSLTGDVGGPVVPDAAGNINTLGTAGRISVTGNPGINTLTWDIDGSIASSYPTDNGTAVPVAGVLNIIANTALVNAGSSVSFSAPGATNIVQLNVTDTSNNTIIGFSAGNGTLTAINSVGLGFGVFNSLTLGDNNTAVGTQSLNVITNTGNNSAFGALSLGNLVNGSDNCAFGILSGSNYAGAESSNVVISNSGVLAENNTTRIGTQGAGAGQQNRAFMAGIIGVAVANQQSVVIDSITGQLGVSGSSAVILNNGLWTPTITIGGSSAGITYAPAPFTQGTWVSWSNAGVNVITATGLIKVTNKGGLTGDILVHGLPFTCTNPAAFGNSSFTAFTTGITLPANGLHIYASVLQGTTTVALNIGYNNGTGTTLMNDTNLNPLPSQFGFQVWYTF